MNEKLELDKGAIHETVLNLISQEKRGLLLDVGAGSGALSLELQKLGFDVVSVDINNYFRAKEVENSIEFILCDVDRNTPFKSGSFDTVVSVEVIEHTENPWHFLRELSNVLKIGGKLYLTTPNVHSIHQRIYFLLSKPFYFFSTGDFEGNKHMTPILFWNLERMLTLAGFEIEKVTFNRAFFPKIKIKNKNLRAPKSFLFGENLIVVAKKIKDPLKWHEKYG
jgi:2-polyprenyl-3-methyl-5-hydroxy-6-metoxy-1,4-benzoquinol methylase